MNLNNELIFLGTSSAVPTKDKGQSCNYLNFLDYKFVIDAGENVQQKLIKQGISLAKIDFILISHFHGDHCFGLLPLLQSMDMEQRNKKLTIIVPKGGKKILKTWGGLFGMPSKYEIKLIEVNAKIQKTVFENDKLLIKAINGIHEVPQICFRIEKKAKKVIDKNYLKKMGVSSNPLFKELKKGKIVKIDGKVFNPKQALKIDKTISFCFVTDTLLTEQIKEFCENTTILLVEATYSKKHELLAMERKHLSTKQINELAKHCKPKKLILTHFSRRYKSIQELLDEVNYENKMLAIEGKNLKF